MSDHQNVGAVMDPLLPAQPSSSNRGRFLGGPKVAVLLISDLEFGGAQRQVIELANHMDPERFQVHVCSLSDYVPLADTLKSGNLHVVQRKSKFDATVIWRLAALLRKLRADVIHCYLFDAQIAGRLAGRLARRPVVIGSERNTDYEIPAKHLVAFALTRWGNDLTIANSNAGAAFNGRKLNQPMARYRVVHNGVDADRFKPGDAGSLKTELGLSAGQPVVGMFASFKPQKNHPLLLRIARTIVQKVPDVRFLFVGDELHKGMSDSVAFKQTIHSLIREYDIEDHCVFTGNRPDVELYYRVCDLTVLPSLFEGTPNAALESMSSGVPIVATDVSDNAQLIPDGRVGFVVPLQAESVLAERICTLLLDPGLRHRMGQAARSWITTEFSGRRLAEKTASVYEEAIRLKAGVG